MKGNLGAIFFPGAAKAVGLCICLGMQMASRAELTVGRNLNISRMPGNQSEPAIAMDPSNPERLFAAAKAYSRTGIAAAYSLDGGASWTKTGGSDGTIADGEDTLPTACCDPTATWDEFGNLFLGYTVANIQGVAVLISTNAGKTFSLAAICGEGHTVDQPTLAAGLGTGAGTLWITYRDYSRLGYPMVAQGAPVNGPGSVGSFKEAQVLPGSSPGNFGDLAIGPQGQVMVSYQSPLEGEHQTHVRVQVDSDGLGPGGFGPVLTAATTGVGGFDYIPAQARRSIDAEPCLGWDNNFKSVHYGRVYLVYTEERPDESNDTDIFLRYSDDVGLNWSTPVRVNDDPGTNSQFLPRLAVDPGSGDVAVCWLDCREDAGAGSVGDRDGVRNDETHLFAAVSTNGGASFSSNLRISSGVSSAPLSASYMDHGDYIGLAFARGIFHPAWTDNSNSTGDNPQGATTFDIYTAAVSLGLNPIADVRIEPHSSSAFVCWSTKTGGTTQVVYGPTTNYAWASSFDSIVSTNHAVFLGGLLPATTYCFRALSRVGAIDYGVAGSFMTTASNAADYPPAGTVPSWWGKFYFGTNVSGSSDLDRDGYSNYAEYCFATAPNNAGSKLNLTVHVLPDEKRVCFHPVQLGRSYQLLARRDFNSPWLTLTNLAQIASNGEGSFNLGSPAWSDCFFRLAVGVGAASATASEGATYFKPAAGNASAVDLSQALDAPQIVWATGGDAVWFGQDSVVQDGMDAGQSGTITNGQATWLETTVEGPGLLRFYWKVSSEADFDRLALLTNGVVQQTVSGEVDWRERSVFLAPGSQVVRWSYGKDANLSSGQDTAWLDQVSFLHSDAPYITLQPSSQTVTAGDGLVLQVTATGEQPLHYLWQRDSVPLGADTNRLVISSAPLEAAGVYSVVVSNAAGWCLSSNAVVTVYGADAFLAEAVDAPHLNWVGGGDARWAGQTNIAMDWVDAGCSGTIRDGQQTWFETSIAGPATVDFWWRVSSEQEYDYLRYSVDGVQQMAVSGQTSWGWYYGQVSEGVHTLRWAYTKDTDNAFGQDRAWIDMINIVPIYSNVVVEASASGWYDCSGFHDPTDSSFAVGTPPGLGTPPLRNWYAFNIPALPHPVAWAQLTLLTRGLSLTNGSALYQLYDVSTPIPALVGGGSGLTNIYQDLGDGAVYGSHPFVNYFSQCTISLSPFFISDVNAAAGRPFAIAGELVSQRNGPVTGEYVFFGSEVPWDAQLTLGLGPSALCIQTPVLTNGWLELAIGNADGTPISPVRMPFIETYASADCRLWSMLTNRAVLTNGVLVVREPVQPSETRFYKVRERVP